jgi:anti-sigma regulatory factor (Ser/Thr protein kinase)
VGATNVEQSDHLSPMVPEIGSRVEGVNAGSSGNSTSMTVSRTFLPEASEVARARRFVSQVLERSRRKVTDEVLLVTSELVTNAILHGRGEIALAVDLDGEDIHLSVRDEGQGAPIQPRPMPDAFSTGGRGLPLVTALSRTWGSQLDDQGHTIVWADLPAPAVAA